jgi:hypothetical protein
MSFTAQLGYAKIALALLLPCYCEWFFSKIPRAGFVFYGTTWLRQDCARPAIASDFFQKSLA